MTDEEKERAEILISRLEIAVGEVLAQDRRLSDIVTRMIQDLGGLRSLLGVVKRKG